MTTKKEPQTLTELIADYEDDGYREKELDWGKAQGNELPW